jgi:hypothetical protein
MQVNRPCVYCIVVSLRVCARVHKHTTRGDGFYRSCIMVQIPTGFHRGISDCVLFPLSGSDQLLSEQIQSALRKHSHVILNGDSECMKHWGRHLNNHRSQTLLPEMHARANMDAR